jgi:hypothetical protein
VPSNSSGARYHSVTTTYGVYEWKSSTNSEKELAQGIPNVQNPRPSQCRTGLSQAAGICAQVQNLRCAICKKTSALCTKRSLSSWQNLRSSGLLHKVFRAGTQGCSEASNHGAAPESSERKQLKDGGNRSLKTTEHTQLPHPVLVQISRAVQQLKQPLSDLFVSKSREFIFDKLVQVGFS